MANTSDVLSAKEREIVDKLAEAWNAFLEVHENEPLHTDHLSEFRHGIHHLQNIIMARPVQRRFNEEIEEEIEKDART